MTVSSEEAKTLLQQLTTAAQQGQPLDDTLWLAMQVSYLADNRVETTIGLHWLRSNPMLAIRSLRKPREFLLTCIGIPRVGRCEHLPGIIINLAKVMSFKSWDTFCYDAMVGIPRKLNFAYLLERAATARDPLKAQQLRQQLLQVATRKGLVAGTVSKQSLSGQSLATIYHQGVTFFLDGSQKMEEGTQVLFRPIRSKPHGTRSFVIVHYMPI